MAALSSFDQVIQNLAQDHDLQRIKKLLIYICKHYWEHDPTQLSDYNLRDLVQELLAIAPTLEHLQFCFNNTVQTINKKAEYTLVTNRIINHLKPLYIEYQNPTQINHYQPEQYLTVAQSLEHDQEQLRIKKLLFCACNNAWENDISKLTHASLAYLVQELHKLAPTPESLDAVLQSIVNTLNRQEIYRAIAEKVNRAFQALYRVEIDSDTQRLVNPTPELTTVQFQAIHSGSAEFGNLAQAETGLLSNLISDSSPDSVPIMRQRDLSDLFDLRLEIIKYTNPLRAKVLLFSLVHSLPSATDKLWFVIRNCEFDILLQNLFQTYKVFAQLQSDLEDAAKRLPEPYQYTQAAAAILRAIRPFYNSSMQGVGSQDSYQLPTLIEQPLHSPAPLLPSNDTLPLSDSSASALPSPHQSNSSVPSSSAASPQGSNSEEHTVQFSPRK
jgi:hypothetical protein